MWRKIQVLQYLKLLTRQEQFVLTTIKEMKLLFGENAGKQCLAMSLTAIIYHHIKDISLWSSSTLNNILVTGNNLYSTWRSIFLD